jgi:hypothetical protein
MHTALLNWRILAEFTLCNLVNAQLFSLEGLLSGNRLSATDFMFLLSVLNVQRSFSFINGHRGCPQSDAEQN